MEPRIQSGDDRDRVFTVRDARVDGNGSTELTGDEFVMRFGEGATTIVYTVDGSVIDRGDHAEARWQVASGWDVEVRFLRASFIAPDPPGSVVCLAGALGSTTPCESALTDHGQVLRVVQQNPPARCRTRWPSATSTTGCPWSPGTASTGTRAHRRPSRRC